MKSSKSMYEVVKTIALKRIPMNMNGKIGFYVPIVEVKKTFFDYGFSVRRKTWTRYVEEWEEYGLAEMDQENEVLWIKDEYAHWRSCNHAERIGISEYRIMS